MEFVVCPECGVPGEVLDSFTLASTDGPLAHVTVRCLDGHRFTGLRERLAPDAGRGVVQLFPTAPPPTHRRRAA